MNHFIRFTLSLILLLPALRAQAPTELRVTSATRQRVELAWTGTGADFTVRRRLSGASTWGNYARVLNSGTTFADTGIDPFLTYQYQVVANLETGPSEPTATVITGPPPAGIATVIPAPSAEAAGRYGYNLTMTFDANGDPAFAFYFLDPDGDSDYSDTQVLFRSWNRVTYDWNPVATVAVVGDSVARFHTSLAMAFDPATALFVIASEINQASGVRVFVARGNAGTWSLKASFLATGVGESIAGPTVAARDGSVHLAFVRSPAGLVYITGKLDAESSAWTQQTAPIPSGTTAAAIDVAPSLALDGRVEPGVAYWVGDTAQTYNRILQLWRPAASTGGAPVRVLDTRNVQSDYAWVRLAWTGTNPRISAWVMRDDAPFGTGVRFVKSDDGGSTWSTAPVIPKDGNPADGYPVELALTSKDAGAVGFPNDGACPGPKLALSSDLVTWKTCSIPGVTAESAFNPMPLALALAYGANDKLWYAWWDSSAPSPGIVLYREAPDGQ